MKPKYKKIIVDDDSVDPGVDPEDRLLSDPTGQGAAGLNDALVGVGISPEKAQIIVNHVYKNVRRLMIFDRNRSSANTGVTTTPITEQITGGSTPTNNES